MYGDQGDIFRETKQRLYDLFILIVPSVGLMKTMTPCPLALSIVYPNDISLTTKKVQ